MIFLAVGFFCVPITFADVMITESSFGEGLVKLTLGYSQES